MAASSEIHLIRVTKHYRTGYRHNTTALDNASLWIRRGETLSVVGPTGCGKSTLLRVSAVTFDGEDVGMLSPSQRGIGLVFQNYALYPHFKVHGNIAFYFRLRRWSPEAIDAKVLETSRIMGIGFEKLLESSRLVTEALKRVLYPNIQQIPSVLRLRTSGAGAASPSGALIRSRP